MKRDRFNAFINSIKAVRTAVDDDTAFSVKDLYPAWSGDGVEYKHDVRVLYEGDLYKCISETPFISQPTWNPKDAHSLWTRIDDPAIEWPEWRQPTGATDGYEYGAKVSHNQKHWISTYNGINIWEPGVYGWEEQS